MCKDHTELETTPVPPTGKLEGGGWETESGESEEVCFHIFLNVLFIDRR